MPRTDVYAQTQPASRAEWRQWLAAYHASASGVARHFAAFSATARKMILTWVLGARQPAA